MSVRADDSMSHVPAASNWNNDIFDSVLGTRLENDLSLEQLLQLFPASQSTSSGNWDASISYDSNWHTPAQNSNSDAEDP